MTNCPRNPSPFIIGNPISPCCTLVLSRRITSGSSASGQPTFVTPRDRRRDVAASASVTIGHASQMPLAISRTAPSTGHHQSTTRLACFFSCLILLFCRSRVVLAHDVCDMDNHLSIDCPIIPTGYRRRAFFLVALVELLMVRYAQNLSNTPRQALVAHSHVAHP
ncbi:hypothetical protein BDZ85DRAFT_29550 [Elsinoe ampelina]|uniref:Uncharacterized protein n=1 Tax=Elsinoe ampelina TaxID=302913 RepID=A0A6A6G4J9_9PEZI|nr:hypothetical protein BDZ85DRAFT_29550 [Elsinoe ampelina]